MNLRSTLRLAAHIVRQDRAVANAMRHVPRPMPFDFARPRIVPLLAGPRFDIPGQELIRSVAGPGCAVEFAVGLGKSLALVDREVADRWECTSDQLREVSLTNLRRRLDQVPVQLATQGTLSGRIVRILRVPPGYASSALLLVDQLIRLFGSHDQVFATPSSSMLVSFNLNTPPTVVAATVAELEADEAMPLLLDPFVLCDGELLWQTADEPDPD